MAVITLLGSAVSALALPFVTLPDPASWPLLEAFGLLEQLKVSEPQAKPPTVYRALDFLLEQGFIHRVESTNSFIQCCSCNAHKHYSHLLICDKCSNVIELQDDSLVALLASNAEKYGFEITNHVIESHGICQSCSSDNKE